MAFNFQNPANTSLGATSTPAKQTGFGSFSSFNNPQQTQSTPAFGQQTSTFGQQSAPAFGQPPGAAPAFGGAPAFGQPNNSAPAFGQQNAGASVFGQQSTSTFGQQNSTLGFGQQTSTTAFGQQATQPTMFGQPVNSAQAPAFGQQAGGFGTTGFGGQPSSAPPFGTTQTAPTATGFGGTPAFGTGGFGTNATVPTLGGFGGFASTTATTSAPNLFGNLGSAPASGFAGFGTTSTTTSAPAFSGFGAAPTSTGFGTGSATTGFGGFGTNFGSNFGKTVGSAPNFGGFGTSFNLSQPGQQQFLPPAQQQAAQQMNPDEAFAQSIFNVSIYGDERDMIIAKWNYLQAMWGTGKAFYSNAAAQPPIDITAQNYLCRFKTMGYSRLPGKDNKIGLVALAINKPLNDIKNQQQQIITNLNQIFGNKPNLVIVIDSLKQLEEKTQIVIYVEEKSQQIPNESKRILATEISNFLNQANIKQQLAGMGIESVLALVLPDEDQLKEYLETPPKGIDPRMWRQAKIDNPDSLKFIPVPMIGFNELKWRIKCQENETDLHVQYLAKLQSDISELKQRHASSTAKIMEHRRKLAELSHKILKIVVKQECTRKVGMPLSAEEEVLKSKLETMQALVSAPTQFKGRLSELLSQIRMQRNQFGGGVTSEYTLDKDSEDEMKAFLTMQQNAMEFLIETVNNDLKALNIITEGMSQLTRS